jgi:hypothetical protein
MSPQETPKTTIEILNFDFVSLTIEEFPMVSADFRVHGAIHAHAGRSHSRSHAPDSPHPDQNG